MAPYDDSQTVPPDDETKSDARPAKDQRSDNNQSSADGKTDGDDAKEGGGKDKDTDKADEKKKRSPWLVPILIVAGLAVAIGGFWYWYSGKDEATTDDAYTDGRAVTIAPQVSGYVVDLAVNDNQFVHAGDPLIHIDQRLFIAARDQARGQLETAKGQLAAARAALDLARVTFPAKLLAAQAQLESANANLIKTLADLKRQTSIARAATTQQDLDQATAGERQARAQVAEADANVKQAEPVPEDITQVSAQVEQWQGQVAQAQAALDQANLNLGYTTVVAAQDGWVTKRNVELGNYVTAGAAIMSLVSPQVWVTANFKENQLNRMHPGQNVRIEVDAYPGLKLEGHVDSIQLGTGGRFTAFPAENATGNFVKIVQRVPVKIDIDSGLDPNRPLSLGLSVDPVVELK